MTAFTGCDTIARSYEIAEPQSGYLSGSTGTTDLWVKTIDVLKVGKFLDKTSFGGPLVDIMM